VFLYECIHLFAFTLAIVAIGVDRPVFERQSNGTNPRLLCYVATSSIDIYHISIGYCLLSEELPFNSDIEQSFFIFYLNYPAVIHALYVAFFFVNNNERFLLLFNLNMHERKNNDIEVPCVCSLLLLR
jgi:hypothetical protein